MPTALTPLVSTGAEHDHGDGDASVWNGRYHADSEYAFDADIPQECRYPQCQRVLTQSDGEVNPAHQPDTAVSEYGHKRRMLFLFPGLRGDVVLEKLFFFFV